MPPEEYTKELEGEPVSSVRMVVGRSNQNREANEGFAWTIKSVADEMYPGLIKDIYIGKGSYNQDLMPQAVLFEMGTHTIDKDRAISSTAYLADVIAQVLGVSTSHAEATPAPSANTTPAPGATGGASSAAPKGTANPVVTPTAPSGSQTGTGTGGDSSGGAWKAVAWIVGVLAVLGIGYFLIFARAGGGSAGSFFKELTGTGHHKDGGDGQ